MSAGNGDDAPAETVRPAGPAALPPFAGKPPQWFLEEAVRRSHHAWESAAYAAEEAREARRAVGATNEQNGRMLAALSRIETRLGIVEANPRTSAPDGVNFAALVFDQTETEVRARKAEIAHVERLRVERLRVRADLWAGAKRVARLTLAAVIVMAPVVWLALKGWFE